MTSRIFRKVFALLAFAMIPGFFFTLGGASWAEDVPGLVVSEFMASNDDTLVDGDGDSSDWIEIHNPTSATVNINQWYMSDDPTTLTKWRFPESATMDLTLAAGARLLVMASGKGEDGDYIDSLDYVHTNFKLGADGESILLIEDTGTTVVSSFLDYPEQYTDISYGIGSASEQTTLIAEGDQATWLVPSDNTLGVAWRARIFTPGAAWQAGQMGLGYETRGTDYSSLIRSTIPSNTHTVYTRQVFNVSDTSAYSALVLRMKYDDGFIAFLNGQQIAAANPPTGNPKWDSQASASHPDAAAVQFEDHAVPDSVPLVSGDNVLAIHGLNYGATSSDMLVMPELTAAKTSGPQDVGFLPTPTPGTTNGESVLGFVADTKFSVDRGFFDSPFQVAIATSTSSATIRYTLDGSDPILTNGADYVTTLTISETTVLRAAAFYDGWKPSNIDTQTYLFIDDVITQSSNGQSPGPRWPTAAINGQVFDYGMDPDVVNEPNYANKIKEALLDLPSLSIVSDFDNLFGSANGIYVNPENDGREWERPASMELLNPDGTEGFQVNAGLRIRGGSSRNPSNPKHSFRVFFRSEYGAAKLNFPLFGEEGADEFDKIDLRTGQNFSWNSGTGYRAENATWLYDTFTRDTHREMGQPYTRGRFYHLYLNG